MSPGQDLGHVYAWADLVDGLVTQWGSWAGLALHVAERRDFAETVESVEKGLRRLATKGTADGGVWGQRVLALFGLPTEVEARVRWMGQYHTRFTDLPASLCVELLRPWDRPPVSESPARIWILLGRAHLELRARRDAVPLLEQAAVLAKQAESAGRVELSLVRAYALGRVDPRAADAALDEADVLLREHGAAMPPDDRACLFARWIDHVAYTLNRPRQGPPDHRAAVDLYERIAPDGPPFARCRRENGLGWSKLKLGDRRAAVRHARAGVAAAGDGGSLRLRAMALNLLAQATEGAESEQAKARALAIAARLEDESLRMRFRRRPRRRPDDR